MRHQYQIRPGHYDSTNSDPSPQTSRKPKKIWRSFCFRSKDIFFGVPRFFCFHFLKQKETWDFCCLKESLLEVRQKTKRTQVLFFGAFVHIYLLQVRTRSKPKKVRHSFLVFQSLNKKLGENKKRTCLNLKSNLQKVLFFLGFWFCRGFDQGISFEFSWSLFQKNPFLLNGTILLKASLRFESNSSSFSKTLLFQTTSSFFNKTLRFQFSFYF